MTRTWTVFVLAALTAGSARAMPLNSSETFGLAASGEIGGAFQRFFGNHADTAQQNPNDAAFYAAMNALSQRLGSGQIQMANKSVGSGRDSSGPTTTVSADLSMNAQSYKASLVLEGTASQFTFSQLALTGAGPEKLLVVWPDRYPVATYTDGQGKTVSHTFQIKDPDITIYNSIVNSVLNALVGATDQYWVLPPWHPL